MLWRSEHTYVVLNAFPYGSGHLLSVPYRHVAGLEELADASTRTSRRVLATVVVALDAAYGPDGMNVGMNLGSAAGAGIPSTCTRTPCRAGTGTPTS